MPARPTQQVLRLGPADAGRPLTAAEFAEGDYAEPWTYERVRGRLVVMSPDGHDHQEAAQPWFEHLIAYRLSHREDVDAVYPNPWVYVSEDDDRIGDFAVYLKGERSGLRIPKRIPELMYEVVSPGRESRERDYVEKRDEYLRAGVLEYVVIDRFERRVTVFTPSAAGHAERVLAQGDTYTSPLLPGLAIPLSEVF